MVRRNNRRMRKESGKQQLVHSWASTSSSGVGSTTVTCGSVGVILNRPCRPERGTIQYFSPSPRSFSFEVRAGNGEEIYRSPTLLSGPIPKSFRFSTPRSTDFATYDVVSNPAFIFTSASGSGINYVGNIYYQYKFVPAAVPF